MEGFVTLVNSAVDNFSARISQMVQKAWERGGAGG